MKVVDTFYVKIYCGRKEGYDGKVHSMEYVKSICKDFCNNFQIGLTLTETTFCYVDGDEPGFVVGIVNYPRFPSNPSDLRKKAFSLGYLLIDKLKQQRLSIETPEKTIMLESEDLNN